MAEIELFDQIRLDALREISSIAIGNAATSLSAMLDRRVNITVPNIMVEALGKVPQLLGRREQTVTVVYLSVSGQISGSILLVLSSSESLRLVKVLTGKTVAQIESLDEMGLSALKEVGNIITGSYLRVLANELKMNITHSIPGLACDMFGAILDEILARLSLETEEAIIMESEFIVRKELYRSHLIFILTPETAKTIIKALGGWGN